MKCTKKKLEKVKKNFKQRAHTRKNLAGIVDVARENGCVL